eukprot:IDg20788t1
MLLSSPRVMLLSNFRYDNCAHALSGCPSKIISHEFVAEERGLRCRFTAENTKP